MKPYQSIFIPSTSIPTSTFCLTMKSTLLTLFLGLAISAPTVHAAFDAGSNSFGSASEILIGSDNFSAATDLTAFTAEPGEDSHHPLAAPADTAVKSAWWKWVATDNGYCTVDTFRNPSVTNFVKDTVISVYTGNAVNNLIRLGGNDDHSYNAFKVDNALSSYSFYAVKGNTYHIAVDGYSANSISPTSNKVILQLRLLPLRKVTRMGIFATAFQSDAFGLVTMNMTPTGALSGKVFYGNKTYAFAGVFGVNGYYQTTFAQKGVPGALPITLLIDGTGDGLAQLTLGAAGIGLSNLPEQVLFTPQNLNTTTGTYTAFIDGSGDPMVGGDGSLAFTIKTTGAITGTVTAPDGISTPFSAALLKNPASGKYTFLAYKSLAAGKSAFAFVGEVEEDGSTDLIAGNVLYVRTAPTNGAIFYPQGLAATLSMKGSTYTKPAAGTRALGFLNPNGTGTLTVTNSGGELAGNVMEGLTLSTANKFTFNSLVRKPSLVLNITTGVVTGSITEPAGKKRTIKGVLTRDAGVPVLRGYVSGFTRNIAMKVAP
jgi:hypothetical protein